MSDKSPPTLHSDDGLTIACERLRRAAPDQWAGFVEALSRCFFDRKDELLRVPPTLGELAQLQGRSQELRHLLGITMSCKTNYERLASTKRAPEA